MSQETLPARPAPQQKTEIANKNPDLRQVLESKEFQDQMAKVLPRHLTPDRMARIAITAMNKTPLLKQCTPASFFGAMLTLSQFGLEPNSRDAHLIPYRNNKAGTVECQLIVDYKGYVKLILQSGTVSNLHADVVCENDDFEYDQGVIIKHKIDFRKPRGAMYAVYATATFKDGMKKSEVMSKSEIEEIRQGSKAKDSGPWKNHWNEMAKKSAVRRLQKWLPISSEIAHLSELEDDRFDNNIQHDAAPRKSVASAVFDAIHQPEDVPTIEGEVVDEQDAEQGEQQQAPPQVDPFDDLPERVPASAIIDYVSNKRPEYVSESDAKQLISKALKTGLDKSWEKMPRQAQIDLMKKWATSFDWPQK